MLRKVLFVVGLALVSGGTLALCAWLRPRCGDMSVCALALAAGAAAWFADDVAKGIGEDAAAAMRERGLTLKDVEAITGLDFSQISRQTRGKERFDYARWARLGAEWEAAFAHRRSLRVGCFSVQENGIVAEALLALTRLLDRKVSA